jgi:hypothetical protein
LKSRLSNLKSPVNKSRTRSNFDDELIESKLTYSPIEMNTEEKAAAIEFSKSSSSELRRHKTISKTEHSQAMNTTIENLQKVSKPCIFFSDEFQTKTPEIDTGIGRAKTNSRHELSLGLYSGQNYLLNIQVY